MRYEVWEKLAHKYNRLWVQKYSLGPTRREVKKIIIPLLKANSSLKILDIGCGTGQLISEVNREIKVGNYLGIDAARNMIAIAEAGNESNLRFQCCPIENFAAEDKYDIVICTHSFPYFPDKDQVLEKIGRMCNKNAVLIIVNSSTNSLKDLIINFFLKATTSEARYLSVKETKRSLEEAGFDIIAVRVIRERFYMPTIALFHSKRK